MKKIHITLLIVAILFIGCASRNTQKDSVTLYKNGIYKIQDEPDHEGYYSIAEVKISENKIVNIDWKIYDSNGRVFDETYEEVFAGNETYQQQCREDLAGAEKYVKDLIVRQKLENVDVISGATWAHGKFENILKLVLEKAK